MVGYDIFTGAFLAKVTEYDFATITGDERAEIIDGYLRRAVSEFKRLCKYDLTGTQNDTDRQFDIDIPAGDLDEIVNIISEGMVVQWLKPYVYKQELLENALNTRDFTTYSPAELLMRVGNAYQKAQKDYLQMTREYSYNTGNLSNLHI